MGEVRCQKGSSWYLVSHQNSSRAPLSKLTDISLPQETGYLQIIKMPLDQLQLPSVISSPLGWICKLLGNLWSVTKTYIYSSVFETASPLWTRESGGKVKQSEILAEPHFNIILESGGYCSSSSLSIPSSKAELNAPATSHWAPLPSHRDYSQPPWRCRWGIETTLLQWLDWMEAWVITLGYSYLYIDVHISGQIYVGPCFGG